MATASPDGQVQVHLDTTRALEQIGDEAAMRSMLPMLQELLERDVPKIAELLASDDVHGAKMLLHSLKGCLPIFCAPSLCDQVTQVEQLSKAGSAAEVAVAFAPLQPKLQELQREVAQYLTVA
jgi:HPt (histidine-containing phosphotransfer) domain-containing protein